MAPMITKIFFCVIESIRPYGTKQFWIFDHFCGIYGPSQKKKSAIFRFLGEMFFFFRRCNFRIFFGVFLRWCTVEWPKMVQNSWKFIFPDFSDKSREKQNFVNFWSFLAFLRCITFMKDSNLGQNEGILA